MRREQIVIDSANPNAPKLIDVRELPHGTRRDTILDAVFTLGAGAALILINDHDIQPLRMALSLSRHGQYDITYLERGPDVWRVHILRTS